MEIFVTKDGRRLGPFSAEQIHSRIAEGLLTPSDLGWYEGCSDWAALTSILGLPAPQTLPPLPPPAVPDAKRPQGLIVTSWILVAFTFIPIINFLASLALLVCVILLFKHKSPDARWHGKLLLWIWGITFVIGFVIGFLIAFAAAFSAAPQ